MPAKSQPTIVFDYALQSVDLFEIRPDTNERQPVRDLGAYMYDVGPAPVFQFDIHIEQLANPSPLARHVDILVEQFFLLESKQIHAYDGLDSSFTDLHAPTPTWVYQSPIELTFTCGQQEHNVVCTSSPMTPTFMDPDNPLTYAAPHAFQVLGYSYRFTLLPSNGLRKDEDLTNNTHQVTFMKR